MNSRIVRIEGDADARRVERALNAIDGVSATVAPGSGKALVQAEPQVEDGALRAAVEEAGGRVAGIESG